MRTKTPERWVIKDLAGLYFSSLDAGLTHRDYFRFMKHYRNRRLRDILRHENEFWIKVKNVGTTCTVIMPSEAEQWMPTIDSVHLIKADYQFQTPCVLPRSKVKSFWINLYAWCRISAWWPLARGVAYHRRQIIF